MTVLAQLGRPVDLRHRFAADRAELVALLAATPRAGWSAPTPCAGWTVHDVAAHLLGDDLGRLGRSRDGWEPLVPAAGEDLPRFIDRINDEWVRAARRCSPEVLVALLTWSGQEVAAWWGAHALDAPADGVSWAGLAAGPLWLDAGRDVTEYWMHEQHIREALGGPTREEAADLAEVLDLLARGLPGALDGAPGTWPDGATVVVVATLAGAPVGTWALGRRDGAWWFDEGDGADVPGAGQPAAAVRVDARHLWRRWTRHPEAATARAAVVGDATLAAHVLDLVAIIRTP